MRLLEDLLPHSTHQLELRCKHVNSGETRSHVQELYKRPILPRFCGVLKFQTSFHHAQLSLSPDLSDAITCIAF